ncbi:MAG: LemA family protein [Candidatus Diapherotrites archaeon]|nr:LemA family protein [Candidatus Diapherotrites archaeon]
MLEWIAAIIVVVILGFVVLGYNSLVQQKNRVKNAWSQIDVQLKKRADLVPNLVETVKGYAKHEKTTFEMVTKARTAYLDAGTVAEKAKATNLLTGALKSLFAVAEAYPELKANKNFEMLQEELDGIESKIAYARQFYNDSVMNYSVTLESFPSNIIAGIFRFKAEKEYFEVEEAEKAVPKVSF